VLAPSAAALKAAEQWLAAGEKDKATKLIEGVGKEAPKEGKLKELLKKAVKSKNGDDFE
jgi:hypothetical protein